MDCPTCGAQLKPGARFCHECGRATRIKVESDVPKESEDFRSNPWIAIWTRPRETIRWIVETDPTKHVLLLAAFRGITEGLTRALSNGSLPTAVAFVIAFIFGPIGSVIGLYFFGELLSRIGGWFGGQATPEEIRAAVAWSFVPGIPAAIAILCSQISLRLPVTPLLALGLVVAAIVLYIWSFVVLLKGLGEVWGFSAWKAWGVIILPGLLLVGAAFACFGLTSVLIP